MRHCSQFRFISLFACAADLSLTETKCMSQFDCQKEEEKKHDGCVVWFRASQAIFISEFGFSFSVIELLIKLMCSREKKRCKYNENHYRLSAVVFETKMRSLAYGIAASIDKWMVSIYIFLVCRNTCFFFRATTKYNPLFRWSHLNSPGFLASAHTHSTQMAGERAASSLVNYLPMINDLVFFFFAFYFSLLAVFLLELCAVGNYGAAESYSWKPQSIRLTQLF